MTTRQEEHMASLNYKKLFFRSIRVYFAPLVGAYRAVKAEYLRMAREDART